jgi:hypothetical protein
VNEFCAYSTVKPILNGVPLVNVTPAAGLTTLTVAVVAVRVGSLADPPHAATNRAQAYTLDRPARRKDMLERLRIATDVANQEK